MVLNIAHRGGAGLAPENTISCFKQGILYADMVEFDIQPSADQQLMIFHDRQNIERTTNGKGTISENTFDYLRSLDAGSWFHSKYQGERIPTLTEVLAILPPTILINLEIKYYNRESDFLERSLFKIIDRFNLQNRIIITARYPENIVRLQSIDPYLKCALLQKERNKNEYFQLLLELGLQTAQIRHSALTQEFIQNCHINNIQVFYFYADEPSKMQEAIDLGVDGILTNYPNRLRMILNKKKG